MRGPAALLLLLVAATPALAHPPATPSTQIRYVMGTLWTVEAAGPRGPAAIVAAFAAIHRVDDLMSTYKPASELSRLNREGHARWVPLSADTYGVLARARAWARATGGAFDPTVGPLVRAWGFDGPSPAIPAPAALAAARARVGWRHLRLDPRRGALFVRAGMACDLGGIAKGTAIDRALAAMRRAGATRARVDAGGQQGFWGPAGSRWRVAIAHPRADDRVLAELTVGPGSVATSGDAERGFWHGGTRYGHVLDARTGWPARAAWSVTVSAATAETADALSTALAVMGPNEARGFLRGVPGVRAVFARPDGTMETLPASGAISGGKVSPAASRRPPAAPRPVRTLHPPPSAPAPASSPPRPAP